MKTVIVFKVAMYLQIRKKKLLELQKKLRNSFKYHANCTGEPMWWPLEVLISSKALAVFQLHPDFRLGQNLRTIISLIVCPCLSYTPAFQFLWEAN